MKINLKRLKLHPRESETFHLVSDGDDEYLAEINGHFLEPIEVEISIENTGTMFVGQGHLKTMVKLPCSRCLKEFTHSIDTEFDIVLAENNEGLNLDEWFVLFHGDEADIRPEVHQAVYMAIPIVPLCKESCQGLCPVCGQDKNIHACNCKEDNIDPRWEKLKSLQ